MKKNRHERLSECDGQEVPQIWSREQGAGFRRCGVGQVLLTAAWLGAVTGPVAAGSLDVLEDRYDVIWSSPSENSSGSMPLGNGTIGLNVWGERDGDLLFYLSRNDAWSENGRLLKLGRIRVALSPNPFVTGQSFKQSLLLRSGQVVIEAGEAGKAVRIRIWVDANHSVVIVDIESQAPIEVKTSLENWRKERRQLVDSELDSAYGLDGDNPEPVFVEPDTIVSADGDRVAWYHRNLRSIWRDNLTHQSLGSLVSKLADPLLHHTFGAAVFGAGLVRTGAAALASASPAKRFTIEVHSLAGRYETPGAWLDALDRRIAEVRQEDASARLADHRRWWRSFWDRSWIHITGFDQADKVSRGYALQRFINACGGRGPQPIKFNGSIFTVDSREPKYLYDADFRRWGPCYWWQNTRLPYHAMLAAGDFDLMMPLFTMYLDALPLARERTRIYYGHAGVFFPETIYFWGTYNNKNYGWDRTGLDIGTTRNQYIRYYWQGGIELAVMMLDYATFSQDKTFLAERIVPLADEVLAFYDQHYRRDDQGKLRIDPGQALETYWDVPNPAPPIAGLRHLLDRLLNLPGDVTTRDQLVNWQRLRRELPSLPIGEVDGEEVLLPAEKLGKKTNIENPELYAVFPYPLYGVGRSDLSLARNTFARRLHKETVGWGQDAIQAACLGLAEEAGHRVVQRFTTPHQGSRFPAFWGPNYDWIPDQDHGGVAMIALQRMLLQTHGDQLLLLPAWPANWDVAFKLHAPAQTTVEGVWHHSAFKSLTVSPVERMKDVVKMRP